MPLTRQLLLFSTTDTKPLNVNDVKGGGHKTYYSPENLNSG